MSPKMEAHGGVGAGALIDASCSAGTDRCASPAPAAAVPLMAEAARPVDTRQPPPAVKRKTCLRISTSPPAETAASANKRATPSNIAVTAGSTSVVASKGMLFSRAELRPAPLSASRKYNGNVGFGFGFGFQTSSSTEMNGDNSSSARGWSGVQPKTRTAPAGPRFNPTSCSSTCAPAAAVVRPSESFATLRIMEARRRAAWAFEPSPRTSPSSPPPSLAALGSRSTGSYRRRSSTEGTGSTAARKTPMPPLPKMKSFAPTSATTAAAAAPPPPPPPPPLPPLPPRHNNSPQLLISAAYCPAGRAVAAAPKEVVVAPLSEPGGREKERTRKTLEQKWAAWQLENQQENQRDGPGPLLGKPAPAPAIPGFGQASSGGCSGGDSGSGGGGGSGSGSGDRKGWGGVGDFHDKVAFLGDYVASVFGRAKRGVSVPQRRDIGDVQAQYGVE